MISPNTIGVVILAAGSSSRLGRPKQLVEHEGKRLLQHTIDCCDEVDFASKNIILGANSEKIVPLTNLKGFTSHLNEFWNEGLSTSIHLAIQIASSNPQIQHLLFLLSDQPFITPVLIQELMEVHEEITACEYKGQLGVPAIFSKKYFDELAALTGDKGAKPVLMKHEKVVKKMAFEKGSIDIDTEEDIEQLNALKQSVE